MKKLETKLGVIGGSGLYELEGLEDVTEHEVMTPFGRPSDTIICGTFDGKSVFFLPRHGRGHRYLPSELNSKANIWALKKLGASHVVSVSAVGSLVEDFRPGDVVIPESLIDRTSGVRPHTFFGRGVVGHVSLADPFCTDLRRRLINAAKESAEGVGVHNSGNYVCVEGPRFSTRAESQLFRSWGAHIIGMTAMPEASLAREAELAYGTLAFVTDYDCWHESEEDVSVESVMAVLKKNVICAKHIISKVIQSLPQSSENPLFSAAENAIMTPIDLIPHETRRALAPLYSKYWYD